MRSAGAVQDQNGVCDPATSVLALFAERNVMDFQFGKRLTAFEFEVFDDEVAIRGLRSVPGRATRCQYEQKHDVKYDSPSKHVFRSRKSGSFKLFKYIFLWCRSSKTEADLENGLS